MSDTSIRPVVASGSRRAFLGALVAGAWCVRPPRGPAQAPALGLLVCGDSMVKTVARSLTREFAAFPSIRMSQLISIGTGLARPDVFDWPAKLKEAAADRPAAVVIMLGANDGQNLRTAQGSVVTEGTPEWTTEYAGRVAALLAQARTAGAEHILWVGMPDMREKPTRAPIPNEATNRLGNLRGTIAMARTPDPHSASSQFFINVVDNAMLDHRAPTFDGFGYCVFGRVSRGMDVVDRIQAVPTTSLGGHAHVPAPPVLLAKVEIR